MGSYGITAELAQLMERELEILEWPEGESGSLAVGGTLFGNPLSMEASRALRGIWEAIVSAGPVVSFAATEPDIEKYLDVFEELIGEIAIG